MEIRPADFDFLRRYLHERSAFVLAPEKEYLLDARLFPVVRDAGLDNLRQLVTELRREPESGLGEAVAEAMAIHESYFFREKHTFDALRDEILPRLIKARDPQRSLSIWSAACARGQEPYSLAMLLNDDFPELRSWSVDLVASDFSRSVLGSAREAVYTQHEVNRGLPASQLTRHFKKVGLDWKVKASIAQGVEFRQLNLRNAWPASLPRVDVLVLANVMIYFDEQTRREVLERAWQQLRPDGFLVLGAAENALTCHEGFRRHAIGRFMACFQRSDAPEGA